MKMKKEKNASPWILNEPYIAIGGGFNVVGIGGSSEERDSQGRSGPPAIDSGFLGDPEEA